MAKKSSPKHRENSRGVSVSISSSVKLYSLSLHISLYLFLQRNTELLSVLSLVKFCGAVAVGVVRWFSGAAGWGIRGLWSVMGEVKRFSAIGI